MVSSQPHCGPGVDSSCNKNKYHEYFLGGGGGVKETDTIFLKSESLKLLEIVGPVQSCIGAALTLTKCHAGTPVICATGNCKVLAGAPFRLTESNSLFRGN